MSPGVRTALRGVGQTLITLGVVLLLYVVYLLWFTGVQTAESQAVLAEDLSSQWSSTPATPAPPAVVPDVPLGNGIAVLRIPRFGDGYHPVIVQGTDTAELKKGPGHYESTQLPGQVGNFAVAGHRTTYGAPFHDVDRLQHGDPIVVEVASSWYVYKVVGNQIVAPTAVEVTAPVPNHPKEVPTKAMMTFTSCHPKYSAKQRIIVYSELDYAQDKSLGPPPELIEEPSGRAPGKESPPSGPAALASVPMPSPGATIPGTSPATEAATVGNRR